ncbi:MAG: amidase [Microvirga sp.]
MDPADLGATELTALFAKGSLSPLEALDAAEARIRRLNPVLNAIVTLDPEGARSAARASSARWAKRTPLSALDGVPVTIKDNLLVRGLRATWGSRLYADFVPDADELPVARLRGAGAVILGKTNVPELTLQGYTDNPLFGPTRNPWDPALTPGGSSGGAVASVASGMAALALATDGGGSIRRPASHAGLFGLKPTVGRVARADGFPAILHDFEVAGPIARTVRDIDVAMAVLAGPDPRDPASVGWAAWRGGFAGPAAPLRILHIPAFEDAPVDREIALSVAEAVRAIEALGHRVEPGTLPFGLADMARIFTVVSQAGAAWLLRRTGQAAEQLTPAIRGLAENGAAGSAADYVEALALADELKRALAAVFERYDVIVTPAAAALPWPAAHSHPEEIDGKPVGPRGHAVFTAFANISGCPGLAVPCALSGSGLPIGMQMVGRRGDDELLLWLAGRYVELRPDCIRRPPLAATA